MGKCEIDMMIFSQITLKVEGRLRFRSLEFARELKVGAQKAEAFWL